jgi:hypothetical protein
MKLKDYIYFEVFYFLIFFDTFPLYFYKFWFGISCTLTQNFAVYFHRIFACMHASFIRFRFITVRILDRHFAFLKCWIC